MTNYDNLPLFPLHVVLFPDMPLPLHIFEPRYREMILRCREERSQFGVTLIGDHSDRGEGAVAHQIGTTARITQYEELPDGRMNILVFGETRFEIVQTYQDQLYLTAQVQPFGDEVRDPHSLQETVATVKQLFRTYLQSLLSMTGRSLSNLQLPSEPENLTYAIASVLQVPLPEKQSLLEMTVTEERLSREVELLRQEIEVQEAFQEFLGSNSQTDLPAYPVDTQELAKLASRN